MSAFTSSSPATVMFDQGFEHGREQAIFCCFGGSKKSHPDFETPAEEADYYDGYHAGVASVD